MKYWICTLVSALVTQAAVAQAEVAGEAESNKPVALSDVSRAFNNMRLRADLAGRPNDNAIIYLLNQIHDNFGYDVSCDSSLFSGINDQNCLIGVKKVFLLLANEILPTNPSLLGISRIEVSDSGAWDTINPNFANFEIALPFDADPGDMARYVKYRLDSPRRMADRKLLVNLVDDIKKQQSAVKFEIEVDPKLTSDQVSRGLNMLDEMQPTLQSFLQTQINQKAQGSKDQESAYSDVIILGREETPVYEDRKQLKVAFDIGKSVTSQKEFLQRQLQYLISSEASDVDVSSETWLRVQKFRLQRDRLDKKVEEIAQKFPKSHVLCGNDNTLPVAKCLMGAEAVLAAIEIVPQTQVRAVDQIVIQDHGPFTSEVSYLARKNNPKTLTVAYSAPVERIAESLMQSERSRGYQIEGTSPQPGDRKQTSAPASNLAPGSTVAVIHQDGTIDEDDEE